MGLSPPYGKCPQLFLWMASISVSCWILLRISMKEVKSDIVVVEGNGEECIGHTSKKYGGRQDPILWEIFQFWLQNDIFTALIVTNTTFIGERSNISPVTLSALSQKPLKHFPPATSSFSSFTFLASRVAIPSVPSAFSKTLQFNYLIECSLQPV